MKKKLYKFINFIAALSVVSSILIMPAYAVSSPTYVMGHRFASVIRASADDSDVIKSEGGYTPNTPDGPPQATGNTNGRQSNKVSETVLNSLSSESSVDWMEDIEERTEEEIKGILQSDKLVNTTLNSQSGSLYLSFESGNTYKILGVSKEFINFLRLKGVDVTTISFSEGTQKEVIKQAGTTEKNHGSMAVTIICVVALGLLMYDRMTRPKSYAGISNSSGDSVGSESERPTVTLKDVEGVEGLKADVMGVVDYLKNPKKYEEIGARVPKGIILYGPPGTGKTLLAKAVAGEASVPFFSAVGSDFVEKYVGVGASRVRDLYKRARAKAPCIVFIDEIDAVAGQRGNDTNSERDQTINALLAELDGFKGSENVITICATNRLDMLDEAFQRAGRFDLKLAVGLPDKNARYNILKIHGKNKKFSKDVNLHSLAVKTQQFSGAELEALLNESALEAVRKGKKEIENEDIEDAFFKIVMKGNKKKREGITQTNRVVAWHEAGHTLATKLLTDDNVTSVTIIGSASGAGGVTFRTQKDDMILHSKRYLENSIKIMYAGRAAEELFFNDPEEVTTGASQDIKQATSILKEYLSLYGMGGLGMLDLSQFRREYVDIIQEASEMAKKLYQETVSLLTENKLVLESLANELLTKETLEEPEIDAVISKAVAIQTEQKKMGHLR